MKSKAEKTKVVPKAIIHCSEWWQHLSLMGGSGGFMRPRRSSLLKRAIKAIIGK